MQGLNIYKTREGFTVADVAYQADPTKRSPEAIKELVKGYPGGITGAGWRKEMERDFTAYSGQLLCYHLIQQYRNKIVIHKPTTAFDYKYGSLDWGRNNPASFHVYIVDVDKNIHSAFEIYKNGMSIPEFSNLIKACPYYSDLLWISADPSIWNKNQETKDGLRSLEDMFREEGLNLRKGKSKDDAVAINELLDRWNKLDDNMPSFTINPRCPRQIWEFERLRYRELTTAMIEKANPHEQLIGKDNHSWDDFKYFISTWLSVPKSEIPQRIEKGSVAEMMLQDEVDADNWRGKYR